MLSDTIHSMRTHTKVVLPLILSVLLITPLFASAQTATLAQYQETINRLLQQIALLQEQINLLMANESTTGASVQPEAASGSASDESAALYGSTAAANHANTAFTFDRILQEGTGGRDVFILQRLLSLFPDIYPEGVITGYFGELTRLAVQRYQTQRGIIRDGTPETTGYGHVGPLTREALNDDLRAHPDAIIDPAAISPSGVPWSSVEDTLPPATGWVPSGTDATTPPTGIDPTLGPTGLPLSPTGAVGPDGTATGGASSSGSGTSPALGPNGLPLTEEGETTTESGAVEPDGSGSE